MHIQFDNAGSELDNAEFELTTAQAPVEQVKPRKGPGYGTLDYPLSERVQSAIDAWGVCDAARYYARHGIKVSEFLILAGHRIRTARSI